MRISTRHKASIAIFAFGIALTLYPVSILSYYAYPILAWGLLGILDALNLRQWGVSLMQRDPQWFAGIIIPASVLFWLFFESLNLLWPQWRYLYAPPDPIAATILSFLSYSTVIPLVMEVFWLVYGPDTSLGLSPNLERWLANLRWLSPAFGIALFAFFVFDRSFVTVQVMWCIPFFLFLPFLLGGTQPLPFPSLKRRGLRIIPSIILAAFVSGLIWETGNYWARTKWDYLLLREAPHLFQMPIAGYLGYIPFALSVLVFYLWLKERVRFTMLGAVILYALALAASYVFIAFYFNAFPP